MKVILILVYLYLSDPPTSTPELRTYQKELASIELCTKAGDALIQEQYKDPRFLKGVFGDCVQLPPKNEI